MGKLTNILQKNINAVKHFAIAFDLLFLVIAALKYFNYLQPFWNIVYIFYLVLLVNLLYFALKIGKIEEGKRDEMSVVYLSKYFFLLTLVIFVVNQFLKRQIVTDFMPYLTGLSIFFGFLTFYSSKERVEREIEKETEDEAKKEIQRKADFAYKFPRINRTPVLRWVVRWMYKEGWWYSGLLIGIVILGFVLRVWNLSYLQGADNFNLLSARALYQTGHFAYPRNLQITYTLAFLFNLFGATLPVARIPFVLIGTVSIFFIYFLGRFVNRKVGLISSFLLAISPVAIEKSSYIREYAENFFWVLLISIVLIGIYVKHKNNPKKFSLISISVFVAIAVALYLYGRVISNETINLVILIGGVLLIVLLFFVIWLNFKKWLFSILFPAVVLLGLAGYYLQKLSYVFVSGITYNNYWLKIFFDPMVQTPMQWFSFSVIPTLILIGLFLLPLMINDEKKKVICILLLVFFSTIGVFVFKVNFQLYSNSRYLYPIYSDYICLFAAGIYYFFKVSWRTFSKAIFCGLMIFLLMMIIIPQNTVHGARHDLSIWSTPPDLRQPTTAGNRNYFYNVFDILKNNSFSNSSVIVCQGAIECNTFLIWEFNFNIDRFYKNKGGNMYDSSNKIYLVNSVEGVDEFDKAISGNPSGYMLWHSGKYGPQDFFLKKNFKYLGSVEGYNLYYWS